MILSIPLQELAPLTMALMVIYVLVKEGSGLIKTWKKNGNVGGNEVGNGLVNQHFNDTVNVRRDVEKMSEWHDPRNPKSIPQVLDKIGDNIKENSDAIKNNTLVMTDLKNSIDKCPENNK